MPTKTEIGHAKTLLGLVRRCADCGASIENRGPLSNACLACTRKRIARGHRERQENLLKAQTFMASPDAKKARRVRVAFGQCVTLSVAAATLGLPADRARRLLRELHVSEDTLA